jgi:hypothetical protein
MSNAEGSRHGAQLFFYFWLFLVQLIGLGVFARGFFLTRVELPFRSECDVSCCYYVFPICYNYPLVHVLKHVASPLHTAQ